MRIGKENIRDVILKELEKSFEVLGMDAGGHMLFWSKIKNKVYFVKPEDLTYDKLVQIGGRVILERVIPPDSEEE